MKRNRYSRALKHLKSTELDEKLQRLNEGPTNSIGGVYALNPPGFRVGIPDPPKVYYPDADGNWPAGIPGTPGELSYTRPAGYWSGGSDWDQQIATDFTQNYLLQDPTGKSTAGLIADDGTVLAQLPPGGKSFILGPIVDGFVPNHTSDAYTNIGYIQKDTRQFVLLARIQGQWKAGLNGNYPVWDGTVGKLTIYNASFTLAMAEWIRDEILAGKYTSNVPYFYSGGVPQVPQSAADCPNCPPGMYGGKGVGGTPFGQGGNPSIGTKQADPTKGGPGDANLWGLVSQVSDPKYTEFWNKIVQPGYSLSPSEQKKLIDYVEKYPDSPETQKFFQNPGNYLNNIQKDYNTGIEIAGLPPQWFWIDPTPPTKGPSGYKKPGTYDPNQFYNLGPGTLPSPNLPQTTPGLSQKQQSPQYAHYVAKGKFISEQEASPTPDASPTPSEPTPSPEVKPEYKTQGMTTGEKSTDYSKAKFNFLQSQTEGFISGFLKGTDVNELDAMFKGTNVAPQTVVQMSSQIEQYNKESKDLSKQASLVWDTVSPQIGAGIAEMNAAIAAKDASLYYSAKFKVDSLFAKSDAAFYLALYAGTKYVNAITQLGTYVKSGKFLPKDPFQIEDPTVKAQKADDEKKKKIDKLIKQLNQAKSDSEKAALLNNLKAYGLAALVAGVVALGIAALFVPAVNMALGPAVIASLKNLFNVSKNTADDLAGIGAKADMSAPGLGNITGQLADDAASVINKLSKTDVSGAKTLANQIDDAAQSGNTELVKKLMQQADDLLYGKVTPKSQTSSQTSKSSSEPSWSRPPRSGGGFGYQGNSYEPQGQVLTESRKRILREVKKPYELPEVPKQKYKMNFKGKFTSQNTPDVTASKKSDDMVKAQNAAGQSWRTNDKYWKGYETTERMNIIYDNVGHGSQYWDMIISENQRKKGWRDREVQEHLNIIAHEKAMIQENPQYQSPFQIEIEEQETMQYDDDPLFKKVKDKLKSQIDYPSKPSRDGYPNNPPPEQVNGLHPNYGERDAYYNRLDPQSANAMPPTGNPKIDAKVEKAKRIKKIIGKKA